MESPIKKLDFNPADKENKPFDDAAAPALSEQVTSKPVQVTKKVEETAVVPAAKSDLDDEPLLRENAQRFVLFPIKYHEVCDASQRVK